MAEHVRGETSPVDEPRRYLSLTLGGFASIGAGMVHALAAGVHAQHVGLARLFAMLALTQVVTGILLVTRENRKVLVVGLVVNGVALVAWLYTRTAGLPWISGLGTREAPDVVDTLCAVLSGIAAVCALADLVYGELFSQRRRPIHLTVVSAIAMPALWFGVSHTHVHSTIPAWPRAYDPSKPLDLSGVPGVSQAQEQRAAALVADAQRELPRWADVSTAVTQGWRSIGDASTGFEHFIKRALLVDDKFLDPSAPESLVYKVDGDARTLVSAMFIADPGTDINDPRLLDFAGRLMQWHVHNNLCWRRSSTGQSVIAGITDIDGKCPPGSVLRGIGIPMVHVWITPNQCGPFAALEGVGAGTAAVPDAQRADVCGVAHTH